MEDTLTIKDLLNLFDSDNAPSYETRCPKCGEATDDDEMFRIRAEYKKALPQGLCPKCFVEWHSKEKLNPNETYYVVKE